MPNVVFDLFCGLGGFSAAFEDADDWRVVTVDKNGEFDPEIQANVFDLRPKDLPAADLILASPPCQAFSLAASFQENFDGDEPQTPAARRSIALVYHTIGLIKGLNPDYWFLENPTGYLRQVIGPPTGFVTYCQYGADYQKQTDLWGDHPPMTYKTCQRNDPCHESNTEDDGRNSVASMPRDLAERAKVPYGLSEAIRDAVDPALENDVPEQSDLRRYVR